MGCEIDTKYIYATGLSPGQEIAMQRYREDFETFMSMYPAGAAS
jgi:predicted peptidase